MYAGTGKYRQVMREFFFLFPRRKNIDIVILVGIKINFEYETTKRGGLFTTTENLLLVTII